MQLRFPSVNFPETTGYLICETYNSSSIGRYQKETVGWARQYATYGDGVTQHEHECNVQSDRLYDFLDSLGSFFRTCRDEEKEFIVTLWRMFDHSDPKTVLFFAGVKHKEDKFQYYNRSENKLTTARSKQYDKRWKEVPTWAKGDAQSIYGMLWGDTDRSLKSLLDAYRLYGQIVEARKLLDGWDVDPYWFIYPEQQEGNKNWDAKGLFDRIFNQVSGMIEGWRDWTHNAARHATLREESEAKTTEPTDEQAA